jgi:hypothetical protein
MFSPENHASRARFMYEAMASAAAGMSLSPAWRASARASEKQLQRVFQQAAS